PQSTRVCLSVMYCVFCAFLLRVFASGSLSSSFGRQETRHAPPSLPGPVSAGWVFARGGRSAGEVRPRRPLRPEPVPPVEPATCRPAHPFRLKRPDDRPRRPRPGRLPHHQALARRADTLRRREAARRVPRRRALRRAVLFAGKNGGLRAVRGDERVPLALSFFRSWAD